MILSATMIILLACSAEKNSDFTPPQEGEWRDEQPVLVEDNCELAYEDSENPEVPPMFINILDILDTSFTFSLPFENDVMWQEDEIPPSTSCTWDDAGSITCSENEYMLIPLSVYFANEPDMPDMSEVEGDMAGILTIEDLSFDGTTLKGSMQNTFDCRGDICSEIGDDNPCRIKKSFQALLQETQPEEE